jgi:hypothetical protein
VLVYFVKMLKISSQYHNIIECFFACPVIKHVLEPPLSGPG